MKNQMFVIVTIALIAALFMAGFAEATPENGLSDLDARMSRDFTWGMTYDEVMALLNPYMSQYKLTCESTESKITCTEYISKVETSEYEFTMSDTVPSYMVGMQFTAGLNSKNVPSYNSQLMNSSFSDLLALSGISYYWEYESPLTDQLAAGWDENLMFVGNNFNTIGMLLGLEDDTSLNLRYILLDADWVYLYGPEPTLDELDIPRDKITELPGLHKPIQYNTARRLSYERDIADAAENGLLDLYLKSSHLDELGNVLSCDVEGNCHPILHEDVVYVVN